MLLDYRVYANTGPAVFRQAPERAESWSLGLCPSRRSLMPGLSRGAVGLPQVQREGLNCSSVTRRKTELAWQMMRKNRVDFIKAVLG
jgi:hypothetical protein